MADVHVSLYGKKEKALLGDARTDDEGLALFQELEPGRGYEIKAAKPTYATVDVLDIEVRAGRQSRVPITLRLESTPPVRILRGVDTDSPIQSLPSISFFEYLEP
jgi:hypothetical protein